jgi:hypothetical protein
VQDGSRVIQPMSGLFGCRLGAEKRKDQCRALLRWAMRDLATNAKANLVIVGGFNEGQPDSHRHDLAVLFRAWPPRVDNSNFTMGKARTHARGKRYTLTL